MPNIRDRVVFLLAALGLAAAAFGAFVNLAPNRLAASTPLPLSDAPAIETIGVLLGLALLLFSSFLPSEKLRAPLSFAAASLLFFASLAGAGHLAAALAEVNPPATRLSLGSAFWIFLGIALLSMLDVAQRANLRVFFRLGLGLFLGAGLFLMAEAGWFDQLSITREFVAHREAFTVALWRHIMLVGAALFCALLVGIPLTHLVLRHKALRGSIFASLGILQTFPSIALFGLLLSPLSALANSFPLLKMIGIGGTGAAPAIIALTLYSALPLVRGFYTGLAGVPADVKDAALGLGFDRRRLLFEIELPLALPALVSGLRVVTIQAIGLATVAALIGAGGLGTFVFQGIGQYALDLVLVGAIPVVCLALATDALFQIVLSGLRRQS
jgi:osmoprotectant transport system permease protein